MNYRERFDIWMKHIPVDDPLRPQLEALEQNETEMAERFSQDMVFGTAGLRGVTGVGTNCMNVYTVGRATRGIVDYILNHSDSGHRAYHIYASRHNTIISPKMS